MEQIIFDELIELLKKTEPSKDVPVSAIIVDENKKIVAKGWNTRNKEQNISCHAEINAINSAIKKMKTLKLNKCKIVITMEPCEMCYGAIKQAHIKKIDYILTNQKYGFSSAYSINDILLSFKQCSTKIQQKIYQQILDNFFQKLR
ncbi:tRNA-specific adenosine deaminase [Williamsoniiplasma somnilux]|uniref:tRNA-specific adenosine deaminase n=1 Tax=Williamsoniiplasma somnilux TaxID=215578 RepID=A0A2K8NZ89_9MOLU|nr:nucleoside deaminase [Williamsoniiplasma somnilux]ATZ19107.1 tRNA-specific adenosine deaminase [Williamsoniiplasma somnilux]